MVGSDGPLEIFQPCFYRAAKPGDTTGPLSSFTVTLEHTFQRQAAHAACVSILVEKFQHILR